MNLTGVQFAGNLILGEITTEVLNGATKGQKAEDFGLGKSGKLADDIAMAWGDAKAYWAAWQRQLNRLEAGDSGTSITRETFVLPLLKSLGYKPVFTPKAEVVGERTYAISHRAEAGVSQPPIHIVGYHQDLDKRAASGVPRLSAHGLVQEYLNKTEHLWGITTNGRYWRLLRDSSLMTRLSYIEFDLEQIISGENYGEFGLFYRLFHRTRLPINSEDGDKCLLEYYYQEGLQQGGRVRDKLRAGVEQAIKCLAQGFLSHPDNHDLCHRFIAVDFYRQLLRLVYRLLFLMVAESRNLLFVGGDEEKARIYWEYYSVERLRLLAERSWQSREGFQDVWQGLRVTFRLFDENWRGELLGLSPLNGDLFGSQGLAFLDGCSVDNFDLLLAIRYLSLYQDKEALRRMNYGALDVEELGSVYESLLDFSPEIRLHGDSYQFYLIPGSDRKTTGSYYTPPSLVQQLIKTTLEPIILEKLNEVDKIKALLSLKIIDPSCGSGHFLLAAARRLGKEIAELRSGHQQPEAETLRQSIRDVIQNCIYGVDLNPLAVDLCKVALWLEGFCAGKPLTFLDHRINCGNSLVGISTTKSPREKGDRGAF